MKQASRGIDQLTVIKKKLSIGPQGGPQPYDNERRADGDESNANPKDDCLQTFSMSKVWRVSVWIGSEGNRGKVGHIYAVV